MGTNRPGEAIRTARQRRGLTLRQLSTRSGFSVSTLSKIERGHTALSYDKLSVLSACVGMDMGELLCGCAPSQPETPRWGARRVVERAAEGELVDAIHGRQRLFATELLSRRMTPSITEPRAETIDEFMQQAGGFVRQSGEEFALVLEGEVEFHSEIYAPHRLKAGDAIYFDADMGHAYLRVGPRPCLVMTIRAPRDEAHDATAGPAAL